MRTLEINKSPYWYVKVIGQEDVVDSEGFSTGEVRDIYSDPERIRLHLYPATGKVVQETFGKHHDIDMVTTTTEEMDKSTLLYVERPSGNYESTYDYKVDEISKSLNYTQYGLKGGV